MRVVALILLGLVIGVFGAVATLNALRPATAFPKGVMALLAHHHGALRDATAGAQCLANAAMHLEALEVVGRDIEPAFVHPEAPDEIFSRYASQFVQAVSEARAQPAQDCATLKEQIGRIGDGCKACHRDYKS